MSILLALTAARDKPQQKTIAPMPRPTAIVITNTTLGTGDQPIKDARTTIEFTAKTKDSTIADTERRGMAFTFLMDQETVEPFWHEAVRNMRVGGTRTIMTPASNLGLVMTGDPTLTVTIKLIKVVPL